MKRRTSEQTNHSETASARLATRIAFFVAGMSSIWAPLVPFAKANVGADEAQFGLILLCLGIGSLVAMPITGVLAARAGAKPIILFGGFGMALALPMVIFPTSGWYLAGALFLVGATVGSLDVSMNIHGARIEELEKRPLMSGFHAFFSVGGFFGASLCTGLLAYGFTPSFTALCGGAIAFVLMLFASSRFLRAKAHEPEPFVLPRGVVLLLALLTGILFLVEGAMLDWGALVLIERNITEAETAGLGYMVFSIAMVLARLNGDRLVGYLGQFRILFFGGLLTAIGLGVIVAASGQTVALTGFLLVGLGASNVVPVLFSLAGRQKIMPPGLAIASISIVGYAGILLGPALIGFAAKLTSLPLAFLALAALMTMLPLTAKIVVPKQ